MTLAAGCNIAAAEPPLQKTSPAKASPSMAGGGPDEAAATERRIDALHSQLQIAPDQEAAWRPLAEAVRGSVTALEALQARRASDPGLHDAVADLRAYTELQETRARNLRSLIAPLERLYDTLGPAQKRRADETFRHFTDAAIRASR